VIRALTRCDNAALLAKEAARILAPEVRRFCFPAVCLIEFAALAGEGLPLLGRLVGCSVAYGLPRHLALTSLSDNFVALIANLLSG
jgi:hypothetical protein